jgi:uncharacterized protein
MAASKLSIKLTDDQQKQIREATGQSISELTLENTPKAELSNKELDDVVGGLQFTFKLVAVKTISWSHDDEWGQIALSLVWRQSLTMAKAPAVISLTPEQRALIRQASGEDLAELAVEQVTAASGWLFQAGGEKLWLLRPARCESNRTDRRRPKPRIDSRLACFRLKVGKSRIHGWGVYAAEPIPAVRDVIEYIGEIVTSQELSERVKDTGETYAIELDQTRTIDGSVGGSGAEIINHSCSPNMRYRRSRDRVFVHSIRSIEQGEELTADYRFRSEVPKVPCRCGAPSCRGTINTV